MRVTTTNNGAVEVIEKKRRNSVPIPIYNLLILDSQSSLFRNYRIWPWAGQALCKSLHKLRPADHCYKVHVYEMHAHEMHAGDMHAYKMHAHKIHAYETHTHQIHAR
jgi:hypothetical protein